MRDIVIHFPPGENAPHLSQVRNFGEELYRSLRDDDRASISIDEIDTATDQLRVTVRSKRQISRIVAMIEKLLKKELLAGRAEVLTELANSFPARSALP